MGKEAGCHCSPDVAWSREVGMSGSHPMRACHIPVAPVIKIFVVLVDIVRVRRSAEAAALNTLRPPLMKHIVSRNLGKCMQSWSND